VRGNAPRQFEELPQPRFLSPTVLRHLGTRFVTSDNRAHGDHNNVNQFVDCVGAFPWIGKGLKVLNNRNPNRFRAGIAILAHGNSSVTLWSSEESTHKCTNPQSPIYLN
jgi:hypothetical protein